MAWMLPNELSGFITTKTSLPIPSTEDCFYWPQEKQWVPERFLKKLKATEKKQLQGTKVIVQKAVSGQSKCRKCGSFVSKGSLRVGYPTSDPRGQYEVLCCWLHVGCSSELLSLLLQEEVDEQQLHQLREDLIVSLTSSEEPSVQAKALREAPHTPKTEGGEGGPEGAPDEGITPPCKQKKQERRQTRVSGLRTKAGKPDGKENLKEEVSTASSTLVPNTGDPFTTSTFSSPGDASSEPGPPQGSSEVLLSLSNEKQEKVEALPRREQLLVERVSSILPIDRLWYKEEGVSPSEEREVFAALADAAQRLFFPNETKDKAAADEATAEEVLENLTKRQIVGRLPTPPGLQMPLLPFQEEGLWWLTQQETVSPVRGGILADEMGMGKTIQMISLLLSRRLPRLPPSAPVSLRPFLCRTLVVTPLAALLQWKSELDRFVSPGSLSVLIYHGPQRAALFSALHEFDVVLTTYQTVEQDFRCQINKTKVTCKYCQRLFLPEKLTIHQRYFCGPEAKRTLKQQLTQRKMKGASARAMETLHIINAEERREREAEAAAAAAGNKKTRSKGKKAKEETNADPDPKAFVPTPSNCFKELLQEANISLSDVRPNPWLGPHFNRRARAATDDSPSSYPNKTRKTSEHDDTHSVSNNDNSNSNSSSSSSSANSSSSSSSANSSSSSSSSTSPNSAALSMADVSCLKVSELRELLRALGSSPQPRMTKKDLLGRIEPLLQRGMCKTDPTAAGDENRAAADSPGKETAECAADDDEEQEEECEDNLRQERQRQTSRERPSHSHNGGRNNNTSNNNNRNNNRKKIRVKEEKRHTDSDEETQQQTQAPPPNTSNSSRSTSNSKKKSSKKNSSKSASSKIPFEYAKPVKHKQPQTQQDDGEETEETSADEEALLVSKPKRKRKASKENKADRKKGSKEAVAKRDNKKKANKKSDRHTKPPPHSSSLRGGPRSQARPPRRRPRATSSDEETDYDSESTPYEPSESATESSSTSSVSLCSSSSDEGSFVSPSDSDSVLSVDSTSRHRGRTSNRRIQQQRRPLAATPMDELLRGNSGDSEEEGEEGGTVRERLEEDPQLVEALRESPIHRVVWQRIILDEAHRIKSRTSSTAQAIFALRSATLKVTATQQLHQQRQQQQQQEGEGAEKEPTEEQRSLENEDATQQKSKDRKDEEGRQKETLKARESGDTHPLRNSKEKTQQKETKQQKKQQQKDDKDPAAHPVQQQHQQQEASSSSTLNKGAQRKNAIAKNNNSNNSNGTEEQQQAAIAPHDASDGIRQKGDYTIAVGGCRWCLTGTPLQNRVGELYSLVRFIRFYPYAYYFCSKKGCSCRSMHYRFPDGKYCEKCSHTRMTHYSFFCRRVVKPIKELGYQGEGIVALETLKKEAYPRTALLPCALSLRRQTLFAAAATWPLLRSQLQLGP